MKRPTFIHGVVLAAALGFFASVMVAALTPFVGLGAVIRLTIPLLALAYLLYLFGRSDERTGRITTLSAWGVMAVLTWWFSPALPFYLLIHVTAIWLVRSLYFYSGLFPALLDFAISTFSIAATVWAVTRSGSVFLATWCFFLVQALFVAIPRNVKHREPPHRDSGGDSERFKQAQRQADAALRQLFTQ